MIRKANMNDLESIMKIIKSTVEEMKIYNNTQWDENYPLEKDFVSDIKKQDLYIYEVDGEVAGFICLNYEEPKEYLGLNWSSNKKAMVIHRMAVNPNFRKTGIASKLLKERYIFNKLKNEFITYKVWFYKNRRNEFFRKGEIFLLL